MLVNVVVPRPWWNPLVYDLKSDFTPEKGTRVLIPLGKTDSVGFINDFQVLNEKKDFEIRTVKKILESKNTLQDLWDLALWTGKTYLCGTGLALKMIFPNNFLKGEPLPEISDLKNASYLDLENTEFKERDFFCPLDSERYDFLINELLKNQKILLLFALKNNAKNFYSKLPDNLKNETFLWQTSESKKQWESWKNIYKGSFRIIIGSQSAVFAPFKPEKIIVEDEANPAYTFFKIPQASARSLAGKRASFLKCEFVTCGRIPSIKTFLRSNPKEKNYYVNKKFFITADSDSSFKESEKGIKGEISLTYSLIERTQKTLSENKNALWILDRLGEAGEIFCVHCGESLKCKICGGILRTKGDLLKCVNCGKIENMPSECEYCHHSETFFSGKRPGLDTLKNIAEKYFDNVILFNNKKINLKKNSLILGTNAVLNLCDNENIGLIAWLELDNELRKPFYDSFSDILFQATDTEILQAECYLNECLFNTGEATLYDYFANFPKECGIELKDWMKYIGWYEGDTLVSEKFKMIFVTLEESRKIVIELVGFRLRHFAFVLLSRILVCPFLGDGFVLLLLIPHELFLISDPRNVLRNVSADRQLAAGGAQLTVDVGKLGLHVPAVPLPLIKLFSAVNKHIDLALQSVVQHG